MCDCPCQDYVTECFCRTLGELRGYRLSEADCRRLLGYLEPVYQIAVKYRKKASLKRKPKPFHDDDELPF